MTNKPKINTQTAGFTLKLAIFVVLLGQLLNPSLVFAAQSDYWANLKQKLFSYAHAEEEQTLSATPADRMFFPNSMGKPDMVVQAVLTAYSSTVDQCDEDPFIAASGKHVYDGMIAANFLPLGTKIKIPSLYGDKIFTVDDRMNARYGYGRADIWMDAPRWKVNEFGVQRVPIEIYYQEQKIAKR
ncbi:MAG: hypothetical protein UR53_C0001G0005 [Candidatus Magasanikbacteria bacterium GW2011_GWC2_34_16]|uniref:3D domain-containing protein n=1 Tax=Candidatus Magasanikbacteria bacterium GW2011_GWC2_34_16 TaxID=1619045 RepID=A0A0G0D8A7_9BACT|nr:MAG: hypothetical protein UR53_C0001G0005 [Candidatus Magasanikbacteria bacterium GW2011_GWC2_34_16]